MKKIIITGGTGFVGANLVYYFLNLGNEVNLIIRKESNLWRLEKIKDKVNFYFSDLENIEDLRKIFEKVKPDIVLHLAAYGTKPRNQQNEKEMFRVNVLGTINLLKVSKQNDVSAFINTGSSSEYGIKNHPISEDNLLEPVNPYGVTKASSTIYCQYFAQIYNFPVATLRLFSPYGPYEDPKRVIPLIIKSCLENKKFSVVNPPPVRDFIFIDDVCEAYSKTIKKIDKIKGEIFNISGGRQYPIDKVFNLVKDITDSESSIEYGNIESHQKEPENWVGDISKAKSLINWDPSCSLKEGLKENIKWFKGNLNLYK